MAQTAYEAAPNRAADATVRGHIAARIDRLPVTRVQWQLALLILATWGFIIFQPRADAHHQRE